MHAHACTLAEAVPPRPLGLLAQAVAVRVTWNSSSPPARLPIEVTDAMDLRPPPMRDCGALGSGDIVKSLKSSGRSEVPAPVLGGAPCGAPPCW